LIKDITKKLLSEIIKKLVKLWNRCVDVDGDYDEK
jgi:hypothetical protein